MTFDLRPTVRPALYKTVGVMRFPQQARIMQLAVDDDDRIHTGQAVYQRKAFLHTEHERRGRERVAVDGLLGQYTCALDAAGRLAR